MDEALATVTFAELAEATRWVTEVPPPPPGRDFSRVAIEDKIQRNGLSLSSQNLIVAHLAVAPQVRSFIQELSQDDPGFPERLVSGFLQHYHGLRAQGMSSGEDLFNSMCMFARRGIRRPQDPMRRPGRAGLPLRDMRGFRAMIMPTKHIPAEQSLLGAGAVVFSELSQPRTVTALWEAVRDSRSVGTFERFVLAVTMLYAVARGAVRGRGDHQGLAMIHSITANQPSFRRVEFTPGLNVILADRTEESSRKDTRNGLGKSTLIEIIHFCLGARLHGLILAAPALEDWAFTMEMSLGGERITVARAVASANTVVVTGLSDDWPDLPSSDLMEQRSFTQVQWRTFLGRALFSLPSADAPKYNPSFRSLISYFVRRGHDAFGDPFTHSRHQQDLGQAAACGAAARVGMAPRYAVAGHQGPGQGSEEPAEARRSQCGAPPRR